MSGSQPRPYPQSENKEEVDLKEAHNNNNNNNNLEDLIEYEIVVHMPPKKRYCLEIDVSGVIKARPKVVLPESITA